MNFLKSIKNLLSPKNLANVASNFFGRYARAFLFLIAIALALFCINLWYGTIYHGEWNDDQKQEYIKNKGQGAVFNEKGFEYDVSAVRARQEEGQKPLSDLTDIFRLKKHPVSSASDVSSSLEDSSVTSVP